jgi:hypothetical protein
LAGEPLVPPPFRLRVAPLFRLPPLQHHGSPHHVNH